MFNDTDSDWTTLFHGIESDTGAYSCAVGNVYGVGDQSDQEDITVEGDIFVCCT